MKNIIIIFNLFGTILWSQSPISGIDKTIELAQTEKKSFVI